jgi:hypothetical protein
MRVRAGSDSGYAEVAGSCEKGYEFQKRREICDYFPSQQ